jgi:hypothetical protein
VFQKRWNTVAALAGTPTFSTAAITRPADTRVRRQTEFKLCDATSMGGRSAMLPPPGDFKLANPKQTHQNSKRIDWVRRPKVALNRKV